MMFMPEAEAEADAAGSARMTPPAPSAAQTPDDGPAYRVRTARADAVALLERTEARYAETHALLSTRAQAAVKAQLSLAAGALKEGDTLALAGAPAKAFVKYQESLRHAHAAGALMNGYLRVDAGVRIVPASAKDGGANSAGTGADAPTVFADPLPPERSDADADDSAENEASLRDESSVEGAGRLRLDLSL
jgi:hypothetical protein